MKQINSVDLWGYKIQYASFDDFVSTLESRVDHSISTTLLAMNSLKIHLGDKNPNLMKIFKDFDYITCDGQSMVWALNLLKGIKTNHLSGVELMIKLIDLANRKGYSVFFLGSHQNLLDKVKEKIDQEFTGIKKVGFQNGYYDIKSDENEVIKKIAHFQPDLLFVAFGSPRKEEFIQKYKNEMNAKIMMGVGGSCEVFVGEKKLDSLTKKLGLRWFVRMAQDPKRLFKRYLICNTYFAKKLFNDMISRK